MNGSPNCQKYTSWLLSLLTYKYIPVFSDRYVGYRGVVMILKGAIGSHLIKSSAYIIELFIEYDPIDECFRLCAGLVVLALQ